ncbi:hypothetical protein ABZ642_18125 [Streptomyces sp. NPDC007157]|uniref:hypothetical protein n=1 Tax=Streptomyces sp. NPDC007157 TaxID=3154681 RepID=UPI0033D3B36E
MEPDAPRVGCACPWRSDRSYDNFTSRTDPAEDFSAAELGDRRVVGAFDEFRRQLHGLPKGMADDDPQRVRLNRARDQAAGDLSNAKSALRQAKGVRDDAANQAGGVHGGCRTDRHRQRRDWARPGRHDVRRLAASPLLSVGREGSKQYGNRF